ncbi:MAG: hypothetical protein R3F11_12900 [Verrucomicrobiales bacterium]
MKKILGSKGAPGVDVLSLIHRFRLPLDFPPKVLAEAERIPEEVPAGEREGREDWRERCVISDRSV